MLKVSQASWITANDSVSDHTLMVSATTDYSRFRFNPVNRPVDKKHVEELIAAVKEKNLLREFPIVVDVDFSIVDGQHRLLAAQALGVPLYYIVSRQMTVDDAWDVNAHVDYWDYRDHLHTWSIRGNQNYIILDDFIKRYPFISFSMARDMLWGSESHKKQAAAFSNGQFVANRVEFAEKVAKTLLDFKRHTVLFKHVPFVRAVMNLVTNPRYDHARMMRKMEYLSAKLKKCPDTKTYMELLTEIYNYRIKDGEFVLLKQVLIRGRATPSTKETKQDAS